jgi:hypothetical protein
MQPFVILRLMVLLTLANGTPVLVKKLFGNRFSRPLDGGIGFIDGRPLLGASKTIRGVLLAILVTSAGALLIGVGLKIGTLVGGIAMAGDVFSSFLKRRIDLPPSSRAIGLDQVPESLFPLLACREALSLTALDIASTVAVFFAGELLLSRLLYRVHLRDQPY